MIQLCFKGMLQEILMVDIIETLFYFLNVHWFFPQIVYDCQ